jgi:hypothetical protein
MYTLVYSIVGGLHFPWTSATSLVPTRLTRRRLISPVLSPTISLKPRAYAYLVLAVRKPDSGTNRGHRCRSELRCSAKQTAGQSTPCPSKWGTHDEARGMCVICRDCLVRTMPIETLENFQENTTHLGKKILIILLG